MGSGRKTGRVPVFKHTRHRPPTVTTAWPGATSGPGPVSRTPPDPTVRPMTRPFTDSIRRAAAVVASAMLVLGTTGAMAQAPAPVAPGAPTVADVPAVPDPKAWAAMSPREQAEHRRRLQEHLRGMTPQQRQAFRAALAERVRNLTPDERGALADDAVRRWSALPPAERQRLAEERRRRIEAMTPAERRQWLAERRAVLETLSPEERERLRAPLPPAGGP